MNKTPIGLVERPKQQPLAIRKTYVFPPKDGRVWGLSKDKRANVTQPHPTVFIPVEGSECPTRMGHWERGRGTCRH